MSENVTSFPDILLPAAALKAYAPIVVKFWENQENALEDLKEFADGWFARRRDGMQAVLEAAIHIRDAGTPSDILQDIRPCSSERWNCWRRMGRPISNKC